METIKEKCIWCDGDGNCYDPDGIRYDCICKNTKPKTIAQGLLSTWKKEKGLDNENSKVAPLEYYLRFNYEERYIKLCNRVGIEPLSFAKWLQKDIKSLI